MRPNANAEMKNDGNLVLKQPDRRVQRGPTVLEPRVPEALLVRRLTSFEQSKLSALAGGMVGRTIVVSHAPNPISEASAEDFAAAFSRAGWKVERQQAPKGATGYWVKYGAESQQSEAKAVAAMLAVLHLTIGQLMDSQIPAERPLELIVGEQPNPIAEGGLQVQSGGP